MLTEDTVRHGGERRRVPFDEMHRLTESPEGPVELDDALTRFTAVEPRKAKLVELRFFAGMSVAEAARGVQTRRSSRRSMVMEPRVHRLRERPN